MAYVKCVRCGMTSFTVAYWSNIDHCGRCGAELPRPAVRSAARSPRRYFRQGLTVPHDTVPSALDLPPAA
jgi:hypothetical protein